MPERCPICDKEECDHPADTKELAKLRGQVRMLEGAIEGWRKHSETLTAERDSARAELGDCAVSLNEARIIASDEAHACHAATTELSKATSVSSSGSCNAYARMSDRNLAEWLNGIESQALTIKQVLKNGVTARECATRILAAVERMRASLRAGTASADGGGGK